MFTDNQFHVPGDKKKMEFGIETIPKSNLSQECLPKPLTEESQSDWGNVISSPVWPYGRKSWESKTPER